MRNKLLKPLSIALMLALMPLSIPVLAGTTIITTDTSWRAIGPEGNLEGRPISSVGLDWEAANLGWNTNPDFDDFSSDWHDAIISSWSELPPVAYGPLIWTDGPLGNGSTPAYFRKKFEVIGTPVSALLQFNVDDDAQVYINGTLVIDDQSGSVGEITINVLPYVKAGINLFAVKAQDSVGGLEWLSVRLEVQYEGEFPTSRDQCKNGGWQAFGFKNQGQCIKYVNTQNEHDQCDKHDKGHK